MSDLRKATEDARRLLRGFKGLEDVADALDKAATLDQRVAELNHLLPQLQAQHADLEQKIQAAQDSLATIRRQAESLDAAAQAHAAETRAAAEKEAAEIVQSGVTRGEYAVTLAQREVQEARAAVEAADALLAAKGAEVEALEKRAEKARAYLAKLAG